MSKKLTQQEFEQRVKDNTNDAYEVVSEYLGKTKPISVKCKKHDIVFTCTAECFMRGKDVRGKCPKCYEEKLEKEKQEKRTEVTCAYCGKKFLKLNSRLQNSKSGLYFCCREHKDLGQRIENNLTEIWPEHYGVKHFVGSTIYRTLAFRNYKHECAICGYNEDERMLEVHHIDSNRQNNELKNLIILCPMCHRKITLGYYKLDVENMQLVKI
jgi:5-methylcytosine-specific restriction endonuclease McrA